MKKELTDTMLLTALLLAILAFGSAAFGQNAMPLPSKPQPQPVNVNDGQVFHRTEDVLYGLTISTLGGMATHRPWIGLVAGTAAGIANEARYGKNFNAKHLLCIEAGAVIGWQLTKWSNRVEKRRHQKEVRQSWIGN